MKLEDFFADMKDIFNDDSADDFDQKVFDLIQEKTGESIENACEVLDSVITIAYKKLGFDPDLSIEAEKEIEWLVEDFCNENYDFDSAKEIIEKFNKANMPIADMWFYPGSLTRSLSFLQELSVDPPEKLKEENPALYKQLDDFSFMIARDVLTCYRTSNYGAEITKQKEHDD